MSVWSCTMKAHWRKLPGKGACPVCHAPEVELWQSGYKSRRMREVDWVAEWVWCADCRAKLSDTPPE